MKILQINASARVEGSNSTRLADAITAKLVAAHPGAAVEVRDLARDPHPMLDEAALGALFTAPAHPNWGGAGVIDERGELIGVGSLHLEQGEEDRKGHINMIVPIDLLRPILGDLLRFGKRNEQPKP